MEHYTLQQSLMVVCGFYLFIFLLVMRKGGKPTWTNNGTRYTIDWGVVLFFFVIGAFAIIADNLKKPYDSYLVLSLLAVGVILVGWVFFQANKTESSKPKHSKKVLYNLTICIECGTDIRKTLLHSVEDEIERLGLGIHRAKKILVGDWRVVEGGYLLKGFSNEEGVKKYTAVIDIEEATPGLQLLEKILEGEAEMKENSSRVHMHFKEGGLVWVYMDEDGLLFVH